MQPSFKFLSLFLGLSALSALTLFSCTRPQAQEASVSFSVPQKIMKQKLNSVGKLANLKLRVLIINVTGPGINSPIYLFQEAREVSGLGQNYSVTVPRGSDRLMQALAVYESESDEGMQFYYGDSKFNANSATVNLSLSVTPIGSASGSGQVSGRFLNGAGSGPTGTLEVSYQPGSAPAIVVAKTPMLNGWFSAFGLIGAQLNYTVNGINIFGGATAIDQIEPVAGSARVVKAVFPESLRVDQREENNIKKFRLHGEDAQVWVWGFFGPQAGARTICTSPALTGSSNNYFNTFATLTGSSDAEGFYSGLADTNNNNVPDSIESYSLSYVFAANLGLVPSPSANSITISGPAMSCAGDAFNDHLNLSLEHFNNGKDSAAGFQGPFQANIITNGTWSYLAPYSFNLDTANLTIMNLKLLPGVSSAYNSVTAYSLPAEVAERFSEMSNSPCNAFSVANNEFGAVPRASRSFSSADETTSFSIATSLTSAERNNSSLALCFASANPAVNSSVIFIRNDLIRLYSNNNNNATPQPWNQVSFRTSQNNFRLTQCVPANVTLFYRDPNNPGLEQYTNITNATSQSISLPTNYSATATPGNCSLSYYSDSSCSTVLSTPTIPANSNTLEFYMQHSNCTSPTLSSPANPGLVATVNSIASTASFFQIYSLSHTSITPTALSLSSGMSSISLMNSGDCQELEFYLANPSQIVTGVQVLGANQNPNVSLYASTGGPSSDYAVGANCTSNPSVSSFSPTALSYASNDYKFKFAIKKLNNNAAEAKLTAGVGSINKTMYVNAIPVTNVQSMAFTSNNNSLSGPYFVGQCLPLEIKPRDLAFVATDFINRYVDLLSQNTDIRLYNQTDCSNPTGSNSILFPGTGSAVVGLKFNMENSGGASQLFLNSPHLNDIARQNSFVNIPASTIQWSPAIWPETEYSLSYRSHSNAPGSWAPPWRSELQYASGDPTKGELTGQGGGGWTSPNVVAGGLVEMTSASGISTKLFDTFLTAADNFSLAFEFQTGATVPNNNDAFIFFDNSATARFKVKFGNNSGDKLAYQHLGTDSVLATNYSNVALASNAIYRVLIVKSGTTISVYEGNLASGSPSLTISTLVNASPAINNIVLQNVQNNGSSYLIKNFVFVRRAINTGERTSLQTYFDAR